MAFPRSFKAQTWFVRLSNGEIESATAKELERSFNCGLVDARTQVRAVGTHVWTTLGKAAEIKDGPTGSLSSAASLSPVAIDEMEAAPPQTDGDVPWHVRNFGESAPRFRSGLGRPLAGLVVLAAIGGMVATATRFADATGIDFTTRSAAMLQAATEPKVITPTEPHRTVVRDSEQTSPRAEDRFAREEMRYMRELDYARRMRGDDKPRAGRSTSRAPSAPAAPQVPVRPSFLRSEPSPRITNPNDPLNGIL
jgi:hypothetical protein